MYPLPPQKLGSSVTDAKNAAVEIGELTLMQRSWRMVHCTDDEDEEAWSKYQELRLSVRKNAPGLSELNILRGSGLGCFIASNAPMWYASWVLIGLLGFQKTH
ncbi:hypothetical protein N7539_009334 [Penicillium diatomitis]|uniref:Uncharacterized protein n=1 Tax=Penicillium diatomitis TaxID=2819901 RepID=A0A9X0BJL3_9EURO|nr:uncharacterized protein N7539_009334 [Penicillium diatomitis]KAJ5469716.1 hypothetical protein N7539_009334 [Penicillium diatomitis]